MSSLESIVLPNGTPLEFPRASICVDRLIYNDLISEPNLRNLINNDSSPAAMSNNVQVINEATALGGNIILPSGLFYINAPIIININYTVFEGAGRGLTTLKMAPNIGANLVNMTGIEGARLYGACIRNLTLDGNGGSNSGGACILLNSCENCTVEDLEVYNAGYNGISSTKTDNLTNLNNSINNVSINYTNHYGLYLTFFDGGEVSNNIIECPYADAIVLLSNQDTSINNNYISRPNQNAIQMQGCQQCDIDNNYIYRAGRSAVYAADNTINTALTNNYIQFTNQANNSYYSISVVDGGLNCNISNNTLYENNTAINDGFTGPNNKVYLAKTILNVLGISLAAGCNKSVILNNMIQPEITTRISNLSTDSLVVDSQPLTSAAALNITSGALKLKTTGGFPAALDYYEETTQALTFSGYTAPVSVNASFCRVGKNITIQLPTITGQTVGGSFISCAAGSIPPRYCPGYDLAFILSGFENSGGHGAYVLVGANGSITIKKDFDASTWQSHPNTGLYAGALSYNSP